MIKVSLWKYKQNLIAVKFLFFMGVFFCGMTIVIEFLLSVLVYCKKGSIVSQVPDYRT